MIEFDNATVESALNTSPITFSHTCSADNNRILFVGVTIREEPPATVTAVTYDGDALTFIRTDDNEADVRTEIWYKIAPSTGTNTVSVTLSGNCIAVVGASSYIGVDQIAPYFLNNHGGFDDAGSSTTMSKSLTTNLLNSWIFNVGGANNSTLTVDSAETERWNDTISFGTGAGADRVVTANDEYTMTWTLGSSNSRAMSCVAFRPAANFISDPSTKDNFLGEDQDINHGTETFIALNNGPFGAYRPILGFDISTLSNALLIEEARMKIYYYTEANDDPSGLTVWAYKLTRDDWHEEQSSWNSYKTGSSWSSAGGDYVTSNPSGDSQDMPAAMGHRWMEFDVKDIVQDAIDNELTHVNILVKFADEDDPADHTPSFYSNNEETQTAKRPRLDIYYKTANNTGFYGANF